MKSGHLGWVHNVYKLRFSRRHPTGTSPFSLDIINMFAKLWDTLSVVYTSMYPPVSHCSDWASNQSLPAEYQNPQTHPDLAFPRCGEKASEKCSVCFTIFPLKSVSILNSSLGYPVRLLIEKRQTTCLWLWCIPPHISVTNKWIIFPEWMHLNNRVRCSPLC